MILDSKFCDIKGDFLRNLTNFKQTLTNSKLKEKKSKKSYNFKNYFYFAGKI